MGLITVALKVQKGPLIFIAVEKMYIHDMETFLTLCQLTGLLEGFIIIRLESILILQHKGG